MVMASGECARFESHSASIHDMAYSDLVFSFDISNALKCAQLHVPAP